MVIRRLVHASELGRLQRQHLLGRRHQPRYSRLDPTAWALAVLGVLQHAQLSYLWSRTPRSGALVLTPAVAFSASASR